MTSELDLIRFCCNKQMKSLGDVSINGLDRNTLNCFRFICLNCGNITDIHTYRLDDEELINELDLYLDKEIKKSILYKELKK